MADWEATRAARTRESFSVATRMLQARLVHHSIVLHCPPHPETGHPEVLLSFISNNARGAKYTINISRMSSDELDVLKDVLNLAIDMGRPLSKHLDDYVKEHEEELSEDLNSRFYRPLPTVVYRKGALAQYSEELFDGCKDVLRKLGFNFNPRANAIVPRSPMAGSREDVREASNVDPTAGIA